MPIFVLRLLSAASRRGWILPLGIGLFVFFTAWPLMAWAEPPGSPIRSAGTFWWYYVVTSATVGYGDVYPATLAGRFVGFYVILGGIATLTAIFARLTETISNLKVRRMRGHAQHDAAGHLVILGYHPGRTERIISLTEGGPIIIAAGDDQVAEHPLPEEEQVLFVRGQLTDESVLRRACVPDAKVVLIDGRDDNEALAIATVVAHITGDTHVVVALRDMDRAETFGYVDEDIRCVQWYSTRMLTEELSDPGISLIYNDLMTPGGQGTYSTRLPAALEGRSFGELQMALGRYEQALVLAVQNGHTTAVSPSWDTALHREDRLFYVADRRFSPDELARVIDRTG